MSEEIRVYRIAKAFPPGDSEYMTFRQKQAELERHIAGNDSIQQAADGLSVFTTFREALANQRKLPMLGAFIVRYTLTLTSSQTLEHLVGSPGHLTYCSDSPASLMADLNTDWCYSDYEDKIVRLDT